MQNSIVLEKPDYILNSVYHGEQTDSSINEIAAAATTLIQQMRGEGKKVLLLVNLMDVGGQTAPARRAALNQINFLDYDKLAIFGGGVFLKQVVQFLITVSNRGAKVRYFDTEQEARAWLLAA